MSQFKPKHAKSIKRIEKELKQMIGSTYGGPSISYEKEKFVIYTWGDAPVNMDVIAEGETLEECIDNYNKVVGVTD